MHIFIHTYKSFYKQPVGYKPLCCYGSPYIIVEAQLFFFQIQKILVILCICLHCVIYQLKLMKVLSSWARSIHLISVTWCRKCVSILVPVPSLLGGVYKLCQLVKEELWKQVMNQEMPYSFFFSFFIWLWISQFISPTSSSHNILWGWDDDLGWDFFLCA